MNRIQSILLVAPILVWSDAALSVFAQHRNQAMAQVAGVILDAATLLPIPDVEVRSRTASARSDATGHYEIALPAGVRELRVAAPDRQPVTKIVIVPEPAENVQQDVLLPAVPSARKVLALDRGSLIGEHGRTLDRDFGQVSNVSVADEYGNSDEFQPLGIGNVRAWSPVWMDAGSIAFGQDRSIHRSENTKQLGVYRFRFGRSGTEQLASGVPASLLSRSPRSMTLALANQKEVYVLQSASYKRIFALAANGGRILSVAWGEDGRIYFTVEDLVRVDARHSVSKSRIASIQPDGADLRSHWAAEDQYSYRYPLSEGGDLLFARFSLDGSRRSIWRTRLSTEERSHVADSALRPVHYNPTAGRLYYIDRHALHLRDLRSGADWVIVTSVEDGSYRRD